jgi:hypothetical protein
MRQGDTHDEKAGASDRRETDGEGESGGLYFLAAAFLGAAFLAGAAFLPVAAALAVER